MLYLIKRLAKLEAKCFSLDREVGSLQGRLLAMEDDRDEAIRRHGEVLQENARLMRRLGVHHD